MREANHDATTSLQIQMFEKQVFAEHHFGLSEANEINELRPRLSKLANLGF
jgi:hypothetical protein